MMRNKTAVVLGASGEIGQAICKTLALTGWSIYIHFNENKAQAEVLQSELVKTYPQLSFKIIQSDLSKVDGAAKLAEKIQFVQAVIVANGQSMYKLLTETTSE